MSNIERYTAAYAGIAKTAGKKYNFNPLFILAQGAIESGWGTSKNCRVGNNFFGVIATKSWHGATRTAVSTQIVNGAPKKITIAFRVYESVEQSFEDFARLITTKYRQCAVSADIATYARCIAASAYISEGNGDSRLQYEKNIKWAGEKIKALI